MRPGAHLVWSVSDKTHEVSLADHQVAVQNEGHEKNEEEVDDDDDEKNDNEKRALLIIFCLGLNLKMNHRNLLIL